MIVDGNVALKWALFGDEVAKEQLRAAGVNGRGLRRLRHGNRTRTRRRTDFGRRFKITVDPYQHMMALLCKSTDAEPKDCGAP